jgi:hypothetical protein
MPIHPAVNVRTDISIGQFIFVQRCSLDNPGL